MSGQASGVKVLSTTPKLREDLRKLLPTLPDHLLEGLIDELQNDFQIFVLEDDLREADENQLTEIKVLIGVQKKIFLQYANSLRRLNEKKHTSGDTVAILFENASGQTMNVTVSDNTEFRTEARSSGNASSGRTVAKGFVGPINFTAGKNLKHIVVAGPNEEEYGAKAHFILTLRNNMPNVPEKKLEELVEELGHRFGVYGPTDLLHVELEDMKTVKSLIGVALESFLKVIQDWQRQMREKRTPPPGMYN